MFGVSRPIRRVFRRECRVVDNQKILRVLFLGGFCEVESPGDDGRAHLRRHRLRGSLLVNSEPKKIEGI